MDTTEFTSIIDAAMLSGSPDEDLIFRGLIAAVTAYTDHWVSSHDGATLATMESEIEGRGENFGSIAHAAGFRPDDAFTVQVLAENLGGTITDCNESYFTDFRAGINRPPL